MHALIFTAKLGGGHRTNARIVAQLLESQGHTQTTIEFTDFFPKFGSKSLVEWGYYLVAVKFPFLWPIVTKIGELIPEKFFVGIANLSFRNKFSQIIETEKPDVLISTYGHLGAVLEIDFPQIPVTTIVCDSFSEIFYWFYGRRDRIVVMSDKVRQYALKQGIEPERLFQIDPLVDKRFLQTIPQAEVRKFRRDLNLPDRFTILVLAGGEGLPNGFKIVKKLVEQFPYANIITVCGKDEAFKISLDKYKTKNIIDNLTVFGFSNQVYELMNLADVVISKAGPASIIETLSLGKQLIILSYYVQEKRNVEFVVENGYGFYEPKIENLISRVKMLQAGQGLAPNKWRPHQDEVKLLDIILHKT